MLLVSIELTPAEETAASNGPMFENAPPILNWPGCKRNGWAPPKWLKNCWPAKPGGNPKLCKWLWFKCTAPSVCAVQWRVVVCFGLIRALELFTGPCGARDERDGTLPRVPDLLGSPLDRVTFPPNRLLLKLASWSLESSSVVVEILLESGASFTFPSLSSSSLSSSLSQKSVESAKDHLIKTI